MSKKTSLFALTIEVQGGSSGNVKCVLPVLTGGGEADGWPKMPKMFSMNRMGSCRVIQPVWQPNDGPMPLISLLRRPVGVPCCGATPAEPARVGPVLSHCGPHSGADTAESPARAGRHQRPALYHLPLRPPRADSAQ